MSFQSFEDPAVAADHPARLAQLRARLAADELDGFIVPRADVHQGEYVADADARLAWLTGFTGSAGFAIVTPDRAGVFIDGRYRVQVKAQVDPHHFTPVPWPETRPSDWLREALPAGGRLGFDPWLHTRQEIETLEKALSDSGIGLIAVDRNPVDVVDNLRARQIQTQSRVLLRTLAFFVLLIGAAAMLMTFPGARQFGASLLASAGLAGLAVGFAARPVLANLIAGLQIAMTQPIRLDDVVIVENEWGRIEEITGTYVVVRIWDDRRLVVPLQYFIEKPFQNWTRRGSSLIGTVFLWADYSLPLEPLREELRRLCKDVPELWDGRVCVLQVTDASEKSIQLRALVSSPDSSRNWDLRCHIRENLLGFIQRQYPHSLPQVRADLSVGHKQRVDMSQPQHVEPERQPPV